MRTTTVSQYQYNDDGVRVKQTVTVNGGTPVVTEYLIDPQNHTGYAKAIEEIVDGQLARSYALGHALVSQAAAGGNVYFFVHDGHGSTRALLNAAGAVTERYAYDAYGETLSGTGLTTAANALTTWLFAGDGQFDPANGLTNHLARWRQGNRFLSLDPFAGLHDEPLSLHKYLYAHGDPANRNDPSGLFSLTEAGVAISISAVTANIGLTVYSGIRHGASASVIAFNVTQNLAIFGLIAGATFVSGPVGLAAIGTLWLAAAKGAYDLYVYWPEMDNVDRSISIALIVTYGAFGIGIRPAPGVPSISEGATAPIPGSYIGRIAIDMQRAPATSPRNAAGFPRNAKWFWREVLRERPEWFSEENAAAIANQRSPKVDATWIKSHPEHQSFLSEVLVHHHLAQGRYAAPLPEAVHHAYTSQLHPN